jgi:hypothetical protein
MLNPGGGHTDQRNPAAAQHQRGGLLLLVANYAAASVDELKRLRPRPRGAGSHRRHSNVGSQRKVRAFSTVSHAPRRPA